MSDSDKITVCEFPDDAAVFMGIYTSEPCICCGNYNKNLGYVIKIDGHRDNTRLVFCSDCMIKLHAKIGQILNRPKNK